MPLNVLHTKLYTPNLPSDLIVRPRLMQQFEQGRSKTVSLICAPAGYGKSILASQWLETCECPYAWISLDEEYFDLHTFLQYLIAAVQQIFSGKLAKTDQLIKGADLPPHDLIATTLINELDDINEEYIIALDDYHLILSDEVHNLINLILKYPPQHMHLIILSRHDPLLGFTSLRAHSQINEIRMGDLLFSKPEIQQLYKTLLNLDLDDDTSQNLLNKTEGWITGLRMISLGIKTNEDVQHLAKQLSGDVNLIAQFLLEEVVEKQSESVKMLLAETSILKRFCSDLVSALSDIHAASNEDTMDGEAFIEWLLKANLFIISLDGHQKWYRYHHLFQDLIKNYFTKNRTEDAIRSSHKRAAEWFEKNGLIKEAIKHMLAAGEADQVAQIVEQHRDDALKNDNWRLLEKWILMLPEEIMMINPSILITWGWVVTNRFRFGELLKVIDASIKLLGEPPPDTITYGELCYLIGWKNLFVDGDIQGSINMLNKSMELIPREPAGVIRAELELQVGLTAHVAGEGKEALQIFENRLLEIYPQTGPIWERLTWGKVALHFLSANLPHSVREAALLCEYSQRNGNLFAEGWSRWFLGTIAFHVYDLDEACRQFDRMIELRYVTYDRATIDGMIGMALTKQMLGRPHEADQAMQQAQEYVEWTKDHAQIDILHAGKARLALLRGDLASAIKWQRSLNAEPLVPGMIFFLTNPFITECRVLLAEGTKSAFLLTSEKLKILNQGISAFNYTCQTIEVLVLQVMACLYLDGEDRALDHLKEVLAQTKPGCWIRPYIEAGPLMENLLIKLTRVEEETHYIYEILNAFKNASQVSAMFPLNSASKALRNSSTGESLSLREAEVIELMTAGLRNKEIAEKLFISNSTVKSHIYNIYQKFNVKSRIQAIEKYKGLKNLE